MERDQNMLFGQQRKMGVGFHNIGSGLLRASHAETVRKVERHYGERCGHLPLNAQELRVLVAENTDAIRTQMEYLSSLMGRTLQPFTADELLQGQKAMTERPLVVPYINVPETEAYVQQELGADVWGLPGRMTHILKNKASFYRLVDEIGLPGFQTPDYRVASVYDLTTAARDFLAVVEEIYHNADMIHEYPLGVMLRAAESDGNYGCCLLYEQAGRVVMVPNGDAGKTLFYRIWSEALLAAQQHLMSTMDVQKETRVVISRYIDFVDSPGLSVVLLDGEVASLRWNGQLQLKGSKACVGTSSYNPDSAALLHLQQLYEEPTATFFEALLRQTAERCQIDFASIRAVANLDIMLPGLLEARLQQRRKAPRVNYLAECNPRWTNYTDAILAMSGITGREPTVANMRAVIREGISTVDKYPLPEHLDPAVVREWIFERDALLKRNGTRIICRMAQKPMGLIFAGDVQLAQREFEQIVASLATKVAS
jgi:hypothetical protein